ncbi:MAG: hypothetical protein IJ586_02225, partial [Alloprevotella sp.]|nr:hypothetical protein [Alloprevotella sp.]
RLCYGPRRTAIGPRASHATTLRYLDDVAPPMCAGTSPAPIVGVALTGYAGVLPAPNRCESSDDKR